MSKQKVNTETGLISEHELNEVLEIHQRRPDGSLRIQYDYQYCPTMAEQHTAHLSDINYLMKTHRPDELAAYLAARGLSRQEIVGWDFSQEPDSTQARNIAYNLKQSFENLSDDVKMHFKNHVEFLKFIDNPANQEKMLKLGLMTKKEIKATSTPEPAQATTPPTSTTSSSPA